MYHPTGNYAETFFSNAYTLFSTNVQARRETMDDPTTFGKCPGQDRKVPAVPELFACPSCSAQVEMWTDETKRTCPNCKNQVLKDSAQKIAG
jgi:hypothetical protein